MAEKKETNVVSNIVNAFFYLLTAGALAIAGWAVSSASKTQDAITDLKVKAELLRASLEEHAKNSGDVAHTKDTLSKHWRLHSWARDEIQEIRKNANMPLSKWPDLKD